MFDIPENDLPPCLKDEARINVLYAPLRSKTVNPKDWDSKLSAWKDIISTYCVHNKVYTFSLASLKNAFRRNGTTPSCLNVVLEDMYNKKELQTLDEFLKQTPKTWKSWIAQVLIKAPISWSFNKFKNSIYSSVDKEQITYVPILIIVSESDKLMSQLPAEYRNRLINFGDFLKIINCDNSKSDDFKILIHNLHNRGKVDIAYLSNKVLNELENFLIKFGDGHIVKPISDIDLAVYKLQQNEQLLSKSVEDLEDQIMSLVREAKSHLVKGHRQLAKTTLRKKHEMEKRLSRKAEALHNVQVLLERIQDTHMDAHIWDSYKQTVSAFETTFKDAGLNEDAVEDTMIKLGEVMDIHDDIQDTLGKPYNMENDSDLEAELAELIKSESEENVNLGDASTTEINSAMQKLDLNLPDVPPTSPNTSVAEQFTL